MRLVLTRVGVTFKFIRNLVAYTASVAIDWETALNQMECKTGEASSLSNSPTQRADSKLTNVPRDHKL